MNFVWLCGHVRGEACAHCAHVMHGVRVQVRTNKHACARARASVHAGVGVHVRVVVGRG